MEPKSSENIPPNLKSRIRLIIASPHAVVKVGIASHHITTHLGNRTGTACKLYFATMYFYYCGDDDEDEYECHAAPMPLPPLLPNTSKYNYTCIQSNLNCSLFSHLYYLKPETGGVEWGKGNENNRNVCQNQHRASANAV